MNVIFKLEEMELIEKLLKKEDEFARETLVSLFDPPKESALKSIDQQELEVKEKVEGLMAFRKKDLEHGVSLFMNECKEDELSKMKEVFFKVCSSIYPLIGDKKKADDITTEDYKFLDQIASRKLANQSYQDASVMFRFLIQMNCFFSPAWVGWADAEQKLEHFEIVEGIYDMALACFPEDYYLVLFATDFYISHKKKSKAIQILKKAKEELIANRMQNSKSFTEIQKSLTLAE